MSNERFEKHHKEREAEIRESVSHYTWQVQVHKLARRIVELEAQIHRASGAMFETEWDLVKFLARKEAEENDV